MELNNKGTEILMNYPTKGKEGLVKAIYFFDQALKCDSTYLTAYLNIATAFDYKKDYKQELAAYNKALKLSNNFPTILTEKGVVLEKMSELTAAKKVYKLARIGFRDSVNNHPNNINFISGYLLLLALTEGKESALKELDKLSSSNRELGSKLTTDYFFYQNFDKREYIYHLTR